MDKYLKIISLFTGITYFSIITFLATPLKYNIKKSIIITMFFILINFILNLYFVVKFNIGLPNRVFLLTVSAVIFIFQDIISSVGGYKQIFIFFTSWWINMMLLFFTSISQMISQGQSVYLLMQFYVFVLICVFVIFFLRKSFFDIILTIDRGWSEFAIIPLSFCTILFLIHTHPFNSGFNKEYIFVNMLIYSLCISVYRVLNVYFINVSRFQSSLKTNELLIIHTEFLKKSVGSINQKLSDFDDFKNQTTYVFEKIYDMISKNDANRSIEYIQNISTDISEYEFEYFCENSVVNAILSKYIQKARKENIGVSVRVCIPESIHIDVMELCLIFSNAIENAIDASLKIKNPKDRKIIVLSNIQNEKIYIKIINRFEGKVHIINGLPYCSRHNHGIGTRSILSISEKYQGFCAFEAKDSTFSLIMVL